MPVSKSPATTPGSAALPLTAGEVLRLALFLIVAGRGGTGKTFLLRWICERCLAAGRSLMIADGDRTNRSLQGFIESVISPSSANDSVMLRWLEAIFEKMVIERFNLVLDLGGGDLLLKQMALELSLMAALEHYNLTPVLLHMLSPEVESLSYLAYLEENALFAPQRTALILNEGLVPASSRGDPDVFARVRAHKVFRAAIGRGAIPIVMPSLPHALEINARRMSFAAAAENARVDGKLPLGFFGGPQVRLWLAAMEAAFAPIAEWLP